MWKKARNVIYKPTEKTSLVRNCVTKVGRIKLLARFNIKVLECLVQAQMMDDGEQNTLDLQWAKKLVKDKTGDATGQDSD